MLQADPNVSQLKLWHALISYKRSEQRAVRKDAVQLTSKKLKKLKKSV